MSQPGNKKQNLRLLSVRIIHGDTEFSPPGGPVAPCTHRKFRSAWSKGLEYAGIEIFRVDDAGRIVEHWDVLQVMLAECANDNEMF